MVNGHTCWWPWTTTVTPAVRLICLHVISGCTWIHLDVGWQVCSFVLESCWTFGSQHILVAESQSQEINVIQYTAASRIPSSVPTFNFCMFRGSLGHSSTSSLGSEDPWDNGRIDIPWFHSTGHVCLFWPCARQCFTLRIIVQQHRSERLGCVICQARRSNGFQATRFLIKSGHMCWMHDVVLTKWIW